MNAEQIETIAQAIADAAYNAAHEALAAELIAHTAPGVVIAQAAPVAAAPVVTLPQATAQPAAQAAQTVNGWTAPDAYAAWRTAHGLTMAQWKEIKADKAATEAIRAAQVAPFDREAQKGDVKAAYAAFQMTAPGALDDTRLTQAAPVAAPVSLTLPGIGQAQAAPVKAPKPQPAGTVALNALKRFTKAHGLQIPARAADVEPGTWEAVVQHVETERAQGHTVSAETVCLWLTSLTGM
jgi:hypothetical protein